MRNIDRQHVNYLITFTMVICLFVACGSSETDSYAMGRSSNSLTDFEKLIADRPSPELEHLADRSSPEVKSTDAIEAFYDILKLRDIGGDDALPVLEKIMASHVDSTRIHGYAAAQALFCIGTQRAREILSKYLLDSHYLASQGIDYAFHWQMNDSKRNSFIDQYHLKNLSDDLKLDLNADVQRDQDLQRISFTLTLQNNSDKPFRIVNNNFYLGRMLYFRSEKGHFFRAVETVDYDMPMPEWLQLAPGDSHVYEINVNVSIKDKLKYESGDVAYEIDETGKFKVYGMLEAPPPTQKQIENLMFENVWSGRAVSKPIEVTITK